MNKKHEDHTEQAENPLETMSVRKAGMFLAVLLIFSIIFIAGMLYASKGAQVSLVPGETAERGEVPGAPEPRPAEPPSGGATIGSNAVFSIKDNDVTRGNGPILLIEYSDFECGFCKRFHPTVQALVDSGEVTWIYRHLPLSGHETADEAAKIADCARIHIGDAGFWKFADTVFSADTVVPGVETYRKIGAEVGLSASQMDACLASDSEASRTVAQHMNEATLFGVNGTPGSFLVNPKTDRVERIPGALPLEDPSGGPSVRGILSQVQ